jgi:anti-sigma factor ChrR (cupin superfamily)
MKLDDVRGGVEAGSEEDLHAYVAAVHQIIRDAHRDWIANMQSIGEAVASMEKIVAQQRRPATTDTDRPHEQLEG